MSERTETAFHHSGSILTKSRNVKTWKQGLSYFIKVMEQSQRVCLTQWGQNVDIEVFKHT